LLTLSDSLLFILNFANIIRFLGGGYGKSSEKAIMQELMQNGPVVVSFEPGYDFMYYQEGVYHSIDASEWIKEGENEPEWEKVDHSVLAYGWGETNNGEKYWLIQNSWGKHWGEKGRFRIRRGVDESAIESMGEASDPIIIQNNKSSFV
jgi:cathepsin C